jgi:hypothetical protein
MANDVYYAVDSDLSSQRQLAVITTGRSYLKARMVCIQNGGDLATPETASKLSDIASLLSANYTKATNVWVGLRRRLTGGDYEWTDENLQPTYQQRRQDLSSWWSSTTEPTLDCVSVVRDTKRLSTVDCNTELPFACQQLPGAPDDSEQVTSETPSGQMSAESKQLALYVVLPLFLCCYGGSCIIYCVHKIIRNCAKAKRAPATVDMSLVTIEHVKHLPSVPAAVAVPHQSGPGLGARDKQQPKMVTTGLDVNAKRPLSSGKHSAVVFPAKAFPMYIAQPAAQRAVTPVQEFKGQPVDQPPAAAEMKTMAPPPPYDREEARRTRLLDNAAREARERRQNSRPSTASTTAAPTLSEPAAEPEAAHSARLLSPRADGSTTPQGLSGMSINDILKMKLAQKADGKRKPRKIITS